MHAWRSSAAAAAGLLLLAIATAAIDVDASDSQSVIDAGGTVAASIMSKYPLNRSNSGGAVPGLFPEPYYWWESGLAWDSLLSYAALTEDDQFNDMISQALLFQVGPDYNYMPPNQTKFLGNDDQSFWALAAMTAEETGFPPPDDINVESWSQLAQAVFDGQTMRWDNESCGGGLRWQIYPFNSGYEYKSSMTNGNFMQLAARLYASTQNETYAQWFNTAADWMSSSGLYDNETGAVYDGISANQCGKVNHVQWTATAGSLISAYAYMLATDPLSVKDPATLRNLLTNAQKAFVTDSDVIQEVACLPNDTCTNDQLAFRAVLVRAFAVVRDAGIQPNFLDSLNINGVLSASAEAAGQQCSGGSDETVCGADWTESEFDGQRGLSEDLAALNVFLANLPQKLGEGSGSGGNLTSGASGSESSSTSSDEPSGTLVGPNATSGTSAPEENVAEARVASVFGLLGALGFAVAFFL